MRGRAQERGGDQQARVQHLPQAHRAHRTRCQPFPSDTGIGRNVLCSLVEGEGGGAVLELYRPWTLSTRR
jgi:hypothetical protein